MIICGDSYIVRVYRRDENNSENIIGMVEIVGGKTQRFTSTKGLLAILGKSGKLNAKTDSFYFADKTG